MDFARRPLSSNVFSLESEGGEKEERGKGEEEERGKEEEEPTEVLEKSTASIKYMSLYRVFFLTGPSKIFLSIRLHSKSHQKVLSV